MIVTRVAKYIRGHFHFFERNITFHSINQRNLQQCDSSDTKNAIIPLKEQSSDPSVLGKTFLPLIMKMNTEYLA